MKRNAWKWTILGGALTFLILYGIEVSTTGIERIYGPIEGGMNYAEESAIAHTEEIIYLSETERKIAALEKELAEIKKLAADDVKSQFDRVLADNPRLPGIPYEAEQPSVNRLADSTSGLLQSMSSNGIRFVVSVFDGLTN